MTATALALTYYNMSAYNTESALMHKDGLLRMLALAQDNGSDIKSLFGIVNLIMLNLSIILNQDIPLPPSFSAPADSASLAFTRPYSLLERVITRSASSINSMLSSETLSELENVLDFIIKAEQAPIDTMYTLYAEAIACTTPDGAIIFPTATAGKASQNINQCCQLAVGIFWGVFQNTLFAGSDVATIDLSTHLESLRSILRKLDLVSWQQYAPEVYPWVCFTAAAACANPTGRIPFVTSCTPVLSASNDTELDLAREGRRYFKWLVEFV